MLRKSHVGIPIYILYNIIRLQLINRSAVVFAAVYVLYIVFLGNLLFPDRCENLQKNVGLSFARNRFKIGNDAISTTFFYIRKCIPAVCSLWHVYLLPTYQYNMLPSSCSIYYYYLREILSTWKLNYSLHFNQTLFPANGHFVTVPTKLGRFI